MELQIQGRNFTEQLTLPEALAIEVQRYSHAATGGPKAAESRATGPDADLWALARLLGCPLKVFEDGQAVWWGLLSEVEIVAANPENESKTRVKYGISLDEMHNRIALAYLYWDADGARRRGTTGWMNDQVSQSTYGIKELLDSSADSNQSHAEEAARKRLAAERFPIATIDLAENAGESYAVLYGKGFWWTLDWRYYGNGNSNDLDTALQAEAMMIYANQFFASVSNEVKADGSNVGSGLLTPQKRNGDSTVLYEVEKLLQMGTVNNRRMLARVDEHRNLRLYEEPEVPAYPYLQTADGDILDRFGSPVSKSSCPVGMWARLHQVQPASLDSALVGDPSLRFIDEMEYDVASDRLTPRARGEWESWKVGSLRDG
jgi:hypothetical protein